jgi:hypothetical protein
LNLSDVQDECGVWSREISIRLFFFYGIISGRPRNGSGARCEAKCSKFDESLGVGRNAPNSDRWMDRLMERNAPILNYLKGRNAPKFEPLEGRNAPKLDHLMMRRNASKLDRLMMRRRGEMLQNWIT